MPQDAADPRSVAQLRAALRETSATADGALGPALHHLDWVAALPSATAPGLIYLAGACKRVAVGGAGRDLTEAAAKLAGETAEVVAQSAPPEPCSAAAEPELESIFGNGSGASRVPAENLTTGRGTSVPASAVHLGGDTRGTPPVSLGLAAGPDREAARLNGLLEVIERDAAARWWLEGATPHALDAALGAQAAGHLARMRHGTTECRPTSFLVLPAPARVPVICALSRAVDGRGLAFGFKAALNIEAGAVGAMLELLQMELALEMARLRKARGRPAGADAGPLARAALDPDGFDTFRPYVPVATEPPPGSLAALVAVLAEEGLAVTAADLPGAPAGWAVAKAFVPGLRPLPGGGKARPGTPGARAELM